LHGMDLSNPCNEGWLRATVSKVMLSSSDRRTDSSDY
jgi:hypothetical protein